MRISLKQAGKLYTLKGNAPVQAVREVNLDVEAGEFVVITGRSGSGKTTLLNLAAGLARPSSGQVFINGRDLWSMTDLEQSRLRNEKMGFIFQFPSLIASLSALENVMLPGMFAKPGGGGELREQAQGLLKELGLGDKQGAHPRNLSAGQQQRVVLARALIQQPELLLADEPTSNLDEQTEKEVIALLQEIHARRGITILLVTHAGQLVTCGTRAIQMTDGMITRDEHLM